MWFVDLWHKGIDMWWRCSSQWRLSRSLQCLEIRITKRIVLFCLACKYCLLLSLCPSVHATVSRSCCFPGGPSFHCGTWDAQTAPSYCLCWTVRPPLLVPYTTADGNPLEVHWCLVVEDLQLLPDFSNDLNISGWLYTCTAEKCVGWKLASLLWSRLREVRYVFERYSLCTDNLSQQICWWGLFIYLVVFNAVNGYGYADGAAIGELD